MKFMLMYKKAPNVYNCFDMLAGDKFGHGASLEELREIKVLGKDGKPTDIEAYAYCCVGPLWSYLYLKIVYEWIFHYCSIVKGWL